MNNLVNYYKVFNCKNFLDQNFIELNKEKIGKFIKKLRLKNKMSQYDLADKIKISRQAVSKWERGESAPSREILIKLSDIFKVSINEFLGGKMKKENEILTYQDEINIIEERLIKIEVELSHLSSISEMHGSFIKKLFFYIKLMLSIIIVLFMVIFI